MEFHIGVSVTVLTSDYDSPNGSPTRKIAKVLLIRILSIELVVNMAAHLYKPHSPYHP